MKKIYYDLRDYLETTTENVREEAKRVRRLRVRLLPWLFGTIFLVFLVFIISAVKEDYRKANVELGDQIQENKATLESSNKKLEDLYELYEKQKLELDKKLEEVKQIRTEKREEQKQAEIKLAVVQPVRSQPVQRVGSVASGLVNARLDPNVARNVMLQYFGAEHWPAMDSLIGVESGYVNQWNKGGSGACGIPQALPCSKLPQGINTPLDQQVHWMANYIRNRYGNPTNAFAFQRCTGYNCGYGVAFKATTWY